MAEGRAMFVGQYERTLDEKSRLAIPPELRKGLGIDAVLTRSFDNCVCIYPATEWESLARAVNDLPQVRPEVRDLARAFFSGTVPCEFDRQGRVIIPAYLREHAGLTADTVIAGVSRRVEIWDRASWLEKQGRFGSEGPRLAEALSVLAR